MGLAYPCQFCAALSGLVVGMVKLPAKVGRTVLERLWTRPTCEVNGLLSGYTGEGAKTVLPAKAMAKVSCRLVPDQDPAEIEKLMKAHVAKVAPKGVKVSVQGTGMVQVKAPMTQVSGDATLMLKGGITMIN